MGSGNGKGRAGTGSEFPGGAGAGLLRAELGASLWLTASSEEPTLHAERGGDGGRVGRAGGARGGENCSPPGRFTEQFPSVVRLEGARQHPSGPSPRPSGCPAGSDWFAHLSLPVSPPGRIPERAGQGTCCSHRRSGLRLRAAPSPALPTGSCPGRPASLPGASRALSPRGVHDSQRHRRPRPLRSRAPCPASPLSSPRPCAGPQPVSAGLPSAFSHRPSPTSSPSCLPWRPGTSPAGG